MFGKNNELAALREKLAELNEQNELEEAAMAGLRAEIDQARLERDEARRKTEANEDEILTLKAEIQKTERLTSEVNAKLAAVNGKLATFDADVEKAAAARFAGLGGDPLPASGNDGKGASELDGLTGLARATAVHKKQSESKK